MVALNTVSRISNNTAQASGDETQAQKEYAAYKAQAAGKAPQSGSVPDAVIAALASRPGYAELARKVAQGSASFSEYTRFSSAVKAELAKNGGPKNTLIIIAVILIAAIACEAYERHEARCEKQPDSCK